MIRKQLARRLYQFIRTQLDQRGNYQTYLYRLHKKPQLHHSPFVTSLIVRLLASGSTTQTLAQKSTRYLRSQLITAGTASYWEVGNNQYQTLPPDIDDTISIYRALYKLHQISAKEYLQSLQLLFKQEVQPGGPYRTWITQKIGSWQEVDTGVNQTIADYLNLQGISLDPLNTYLTDSCSGKSRYYTSPVFERLFAQNYPNQIPHNDNLVIRAANLYRQKLKLPLTTIKELISQIENPQTNHGFILANHANNSPELAGAPAFTASLLLLSLEEVSTNPIRDIQRLLENALYQPVPDSFVPLHTQIFDYSQNLNSYIDDHSKDNFIPLLQSSFQLISKSLDYIQPSRHREMMQIFTKALAGIQNRSPNRNYPLLIAPICMMRALQWNQNDQTALLGLLKNILNARSLLDDLQDAHADTQHQLITPVTSQLKLGIAFPKVVQNIMQKVFKHRKQAETLAFRLEHRLCRSAYLPTLISPILEAEQRHRLYCALQTGLHWPAPPEAHTQDNAPVRP